MGSFRLESIFSDVFLVTIIYFNVSSTMADAVPLADCFRSCFCSQNYDRLFSSKENFLGHIFPCLHCFIVKCLSLLYLFYLRLLP